MKTSIGAFLVAAGLLSAPLHTSAQMNLGGGDYGLGRTAANVAVAAAAVGLVVLVVRHSKSRLTGCVLTVDDGIVLVNEGDRHRYTLVGRATSQAHSGERVTVEGKRLKGANGTLALRTDKITASPGSCAT